MEVLKTNGYVSGAALLDKKIDEMREYKIGRAHV